MRRSPAFDATLERHSVAVAVAFLVLVRVLQVRLLGWGTGLEPGLFLRYAELWLNGRAYIDVQPEYPPGAFPLFLIPLLIGGAANYPAMFALEMAVFDLIGCVLVVKCAESRAVVWPGPLLASVLYTLVTAALYPVLYTRFDLVPAVLVLGAVSCLHRQRPRTSAVLIGIAGAVKVWPLALVPIWLGWAALHGGKKRVLRAGAWVASGALLTSLPMLPLARSNALSFLQFHAARGIQIESTWATLALVLSQLGLASVRREFNFGAFHLAGRLASVFATISTPVMLVLALAPQALALARRFRSERRGIPSARAFDYAATGAVLGLLIGGKVLSPQFMLWIATLLPLMVEGPVDFFFVLAIGILTTAIYPYLYPALAQEAPGHTLALITLGARNLLLMAWYGIALHPDSGRAGLEGS
jgi:hypothetical protein